MLFSFSFNGIKKDFVIAERGKRRSAFAPITRNLLTVPNMPGAYLQSSETQVRTISQPIVINGTDRLNVRKLEEEIASWLITNEPKELIFDDEPDRVYYAIVDGGLEIEDIVRFGRGEVLFICLDPYKYKGSSETVFFATNPSLIENEGSVATYPIFRANVLESLTNLDIISGDQYMRVGQPYTVTQTPVEAETRIFWDEMAALTGWSQAEYVDNGHVAGQIAVHNGYAFYPELVGQVVEDGVWQGPSMKKNLPESVQDFKMEAIVQLSNGEAEPGQTGMIEIYLLDAVGNVVGKIGIEDYSRSAVESHFKAKAGDAIDGTWFGDHTSPGWKNFKGVLRLEREGADWYAYIAQVDDKTGAHNYMLGSKRNVHLEDKGLKYTAPISQIQVAFRMFPGSDRVQMFVHDLKVWRKNTVQSENIPYIAAPGDLIEIDHGTNNISINGESRIDLKDFGATFFPLEKGSNPIFYLPLESVELNIEYKERFL
jgi:predicted phage tail component-like protein